MLFTALTEKEVIKVENILKRYNIRYQVDIDKDVSKSNEKSLQNDIRHLNMASLSDGLLQIEISDEDIEKIDSDGINELEKYNIFLELPVSKFFNHLNTIENFLPSHESSEHNKKNNFFKIFFGLLIVLSLFVLLYFLNNNA